MINKKKKKTVEELLEEISSKIDKLTGIIAIQGKNRGQQLKILSGLDFTSKEIGDLLGIHPGAVRNMLFTAKKKKIKTKSTKR